MHQVGSFKQKKLAAGLSIAIIAIAGRTQYRWQAPRSFMLSAKADF